ncbi:MAG: hypothetical protein DRP70_17170 [Spirochaetes bacterium]|nr:MAG: hypothetical protein DRP70_17170 [Spirochaetota bacterium]
MAVKTNAVILILLMSALSGLATEDGFARYQLIIDKHPFGEEPLEAETVQISLNQSFARHLRLSMLFEGPGGDVRAGIIDTKEKKNYILSIGEVEGGLELIEADLSASEAMLRKGSEVALFKLESDTPEPLSKSQQAARRSSYAGRRSARLAAANKSTKPKKPEAPRLTGEALRAHLENVQMNAIRDGLPPLPLPLTPEMDAQLVAEGVLDPQ